MCKYASLWFILFPVMCCSVIFGESVPAPAAASYEAADTEEAEVIVVTATRVETPISEVSSSVTVITKKDMEASHKRSVLDVLRSVPAIDVVQTGAATGTTYVFLRGTNPEHTLVLVDGIEVNDPISPSRAFDFGKMSVDNLDRIEIVRGPQSTLHGSDSMGGVINIITRDGKGPLSTSVDVEGGAAGTAAFRASAGGGGEKAGMTFSISRFQTEGISAAGEKYGNTEKDGASEVNVSAKLNLQPQTTFKTNLVFRYTDADADLDNWGGAFGDDPNYTLSSREAVVGAQAVISSFDETRVHRFGAGASFIERSFRNDTDPDHPVDLERSNYDGMTYKFTWQHDMHLTQSFTATAGIEDEIEKGSYDYYSESLWGPYSDAMADQKANTLSLYAQGQYERGEKLFLTLGARWDDHSEFGSHGTYRMTAGWLPIEKLKLKGTIGTGFRAPSLYQLYSSYGNASLQPEESVGWDVGLECYPGGKKTSLGVTCFANDFDNLIQYDSGTFTYQNIAKATTKGVEAVAVWEPSEAWRFSVSYTYTDAVDETTGQDLIRRAPHKAGLNVRYRPERWLFDLGVVYVGERDDFDFSTWPATPVVLDAYTLVSLALSYDLTENSTVFCRLENVLDEDYEEVYGYGTLGFSAYLGMKVTF